MEMMLSGNYVTPTINGDFYYNKPPLYNWILILFFKIFGNFSEWTLRIPAILSMAGFTISIFHFSRKELGDKGAVMSALMFLTCGRILFWDSMLGLIDIFFSWITFLSIMWIIKYVRKEKFLTVFLLSYLVRSAGFLMKGLPSLVFQAITLLTVFIATGNFRILFSWKHFASIGLFLVICLAYFLLYSQYNGLDVYYKTLWVESSKRTVAEHTIQNSILHVLSFHPKMIYHFFPWAALVILFVRKDIIKKLRHNRFISLLILVFFTNIIIYWLSPSTIPRYLLMLAPLSFMVFAWWLNHGNDKDSLWYKIVMSLFLYAIPLMSMAFCVGLMFSEESQGVENLILKAGIPLLIMVGLTAIWLAGKRRNGIFFVVTILLVARIAYNLVYLPLRTENMAETEQKNLVQEMIEIIDDHEIRTLGKTYVDHGVIMYLEAHTREVLNTDYTQPKQGIYYLASPASIKRAGLSAEKYEVQHKSFILFEHQPLYLILIN